MLNLLKKLLKKKSILIIGILCICIFTVYLIWLIKAKSQSAVSQKTFENAQTNTETKAMTLETSSMTIETEDTSIDADVVVDETVTEPKIILTEEERVQIQEKANEDAKEREELINEAPPAQTSNIEPSDNSQNTFVLPVNCIMQDPELPTGCEVTSLTIVLNYLGFSVDKCVLSDNYLPKGEIGTVSPWKAFVGDPRLSNSYGCYAPVIVNTATSYLKSVGAKSKYTVKQLSDYNYEMLFEQLREGNPIIIWGAININKDPYYSTTWNLAGQDITWLSNEHCMVLIGYNLSTNKVIVADPLRGKVEYDLDLFFHRYSQFFSQAVIIRKATPNEIAQETTTSTPETTKSNQETTKSNQPTTISNQETTKSNQPTTISNQETTKASQDTSSGIQETTKTNLETTNNILGSTMTN